MTTPHDISRIDAMDKEIDSWRKYFLDEILSKDFNYLPEKYKNRLSAYFLSIPSLSFTTPNQEWNKCICALLQTLGDKE